MLREMFSVVMLMCVQAASMTLQAIGQTASAAGQILKIHFTRMAVRHDEKYAVDVDFGEDEEPTQATDKSQVN